MDYYYFKYYHYKYFKYYHYKYYYMHNILSVTTKRFIINDNIVIKILILFI